MYDTDFGFGFRGSTTAYTHNTLSFATHPSSNHPRNPPEATFLLRSLLKNENFRINFINRFADQLNTAFLPERTTSVITELKQQIKAEIEEHIFRWKAPASYHQWHKNVSAMLTFAEHRPKHQMQHINDYFKLNGTYELKLNVSNQLMGHARVNSIEISAETTGVRQYPYPWKGKYFRGIPIELEAIPKPGYVFTHWEGDVNSTSAVVKLTPGADIEVMAHFKRTNEPVLLHYWLFDTSIPNDTPLEWLDAFYGILSGGKLEYASCFEGYPFDENHPQWRKASMERRNQPTPINYRPEANNFTSYANANMRGLQVRQPFTDAGKQNTMIFHVPTTGFSNIVWRFAAKDEGAADYLIIDYAVDKDDDTWTDDGLVNNVLPLSSWYQLFEVDFSEIASVSNNANFRLRIRFGGNNMSEDAGNRVTFNNISMDGLAKNAFNIHASASNNGSISPFGTVPVYEDGNMDFFILPKENFLIKDVVVDNESVGESLTFHGDTAFFCFRSVQNNHTIHVNFLFDHRLFDDTERMRVFPNPANEIITIVSLDEFTQLEIRNISGQSLINRPNLSSKEHSINIGHLQHGVYFVSIHTKHGRFTKKIMIIK